MSCLKLLRVMPMFGFFFKPSINAKIKHIDKQGLSCYYATACCEQLLYNDQQDIKTLDDMRQRAQNIVNFTKAMQNLGQPLYIMHDDFGEIYISLDKKNNLTIVKKSPIIL